MGPGCAGVGVPDRDGSSRAAGGGHPILTLTQAADQGSLPGLPRSDGKVASHAVELWPPGASIGRIVGRLGSCRARLEHLGPGAIDGQSLMRLSCRPSLLGESGSRDGAALSHPLPVTLLGYAAASLTSLSFFPQAYKTVRSGDTRALSLPMCLLRTSALAIWLLYGLFSQSGPIAVANGLSLMPMALVLERKLRNRRQAGPDPIANT